MLGKLLKHEFRATGRIMGPLYLVLLVLSICSNVSVRLLDIADNRLLNILGGLVMVLFVLVIFAVFIVTFILMINRFRTNLLGDEGYVMFTLPASIHAHVWSKFLVSIVWTAASCGAVCLAALIAVFRVSYINDILEAFRQIFQQLTSYYVLNGAAFAAEALLAAAVAYAAVCLEFYAAMAVGHSFAGHKSLLSIVFFLVFQFILQFVGLTGLFSFNGFNIFNISGIAAVHMVLWACIVGSLITAAIFYVITVMMLKRRLNLE